MRAHASAGVSLAAGLILGGAAVFSPADAVVINNPAAGDALPNGAGFSSVVNLVTSGGAQWCTGTMISSTTILTAQHCLAGLSGGGVQLKASGGAVIESKAISGAFAMPGDSNTTNYLDGTDIAVVTIGSAFATPVTAMRMMDSTSIVGRVATIVGYGRSGVGTTGATVNDAKRRGAQNVVDHYGMALDAVWGIGCGGPNPQVVEPYQTGNIFSTDFDNTSGTSNALCGTNVDSDATMLAEEGATAIGDSGSPLLIFDTTFNEYLIAGVLSGGTSSGSTYGDISWWTAIAAANVGGFNPHSFLDGFGDFATQLVEVAEANMFALFALALFGMAAHRHRTFNR